MRLQYLALLQSYLPIQMGQREEEKIPPIRQIMICPGSRWPNKQLSSEVWVAFLQRIEGKKVFVWGDEQEKRICRDIADVVGGEVLSEKLSLPAWQRKMGEMDLIIAVDSSALHLAEVSGKPTFSIFGPSSPALFKPLGQKHGTHWGACPYGKRFVKTCPALRTCATGACMKEISPEALTTSFQQFMRELGEEPQNRHVF
jgi:heptosyltransferase I